VVADTDPDRLKLLSQALDEIDRAIQEKKTFWNVVMRVDAELLQALCEGASSTKQINLIAEKYRDASHLASPREYASVLDQIDFLIAMAGSRKQVAKALTSLRRKLGADGARKEKISE